MFNSLSLPMNSRRKRRPCKRLIAALATLVSVFKQTDSATQAASVSELSRRRTFKQTGKSQNHPRPLVSESDAPLGIPLRNQYQIQEGGEWSEIGSG
jgi:hypothetical protein